MSKRADEPPTLGIAMYRPEDWARLRRIAADSEALERTWTERCQTVVKLESEMRAAGIEYEPVLVDLDELVRFCREHELENNGEARASFVVEVLRRRHGTGVDRPPRTSRDPVER